MVNSVDWKSKTVFSGKLLSSRHMHSQGGLGGLVSPFLKVHNFTKIIQKIKY